MDKELQKRRLMFQSVRAIDDLIAEAQRLDKPRAVVLLRAARKAALADYGAFVRQSKAQTKD